MLVQLDMNSTRVTTDTYVKVLIVGCNYSRSIFLQIKWSFHYYFSKLFYFSKHVFLTFS